MLLLGICAVRDLNQRSPVRATHHIFTSQGEMGMPTDQIAKVFKMDASEVVKILEQAERSTSKDGVDVGTG